MIPAILLGKLKRICHKLAAGVVEGAHNTAGTRQAGKGVLVLAVGVCGGVGGLFSDAVNYNDTH